jgi:glycine/D-amino acid oxidase-like deaminating enzyme/nitrite reductase/ring-hydroxylating ferredoxin subunit
MNAEQERSRSLWMQQPLMRKAPLRRDLKTDVLVVGAGIAGLSTAYELARQGADVAIVDRGAIGGGMTARTSAHLSFEPDDFYHELISLRGERMARFYYESQKAAVDRIEAICEKESIACDFTRLDLFIYAPDEEGRRTLEKEIDAAKRVGFKGVNWADAPVAGHTEGALRFPNQARFHPLKYLSGLEKILDGGAEIYGGTNIVSVDETENGIVAETESGHRIEAIAAILATNTPFVDPVAIHTKQAPYRTYVIAAPIARGAEPDALIWDTLDPYHYVRLQKQGRETLLIIGGEDHKTGTEDTGKQRLKRLERWARKRFPGLGEVRYAWSGQVYEPADSVQFIGAAPKHEKVFMVSGDSGSGLTTGVAASLILPDLIAGKKNPWAELYDPSRKVASGLGTFIQENMEAARHWLEHVLPTSQTKPPPARDKGAVVTMGGKKVAAYRDEKGVLHRMSASCTHLGCVVQWNSLERCWDCPCHGSQFAATGEVLQGPAVKPLAPVEEKGSKKKARRRTGRKAAQEEHAKA